MQKVTFSIVLAITIVLSLSTFGLKVSFNTGNQVTLASVFPATGCPPTIGLSTPQANGLSVSVNGGTAPCGTGTTITSISWDWGDGTMSASWFPASHTYCAGGTYTIIATSHQSDGQTASASTSASVSGPSCSPAVYLDGPAIRGQTVTVDGAAQLCAPGTSLTSISWTWGDGTTSTSNLPASHSYTLGGSFTITATVHRSDGATGAGYASVTLPGTSNYLQSIGPREINGDPCAPGLTGAGKMQAFAMNESNPTIMYAGGGIGPGNSGPSSQGGLFKTTNDGASWTAVNNGLSDPMVDAVWIDQQNSSVLLAGTYLTGIFRSVDGGSHWSLVYSSSTGAFGQSSSTIYAATASGVVQSTDGGATWSIATSTTAPARSIAVSGGTVYAGLDNGNVIVRLTATGSWQTVLTDPNFWVWSLAVDPSNTQTAFAVEFFNYQQNNLFVTHNGGTSWSTVPVSGAVQFVALNASQPQDIYVGDDPAFYRSTDGGLTFSSLQISPRFPDIRYINPFPHGPLIVGSDQGLFASNDGGNTWTSLNGNLATSLLTGIAVNHGTILTTVQDYSPITSYDRGSTWLLGSGIGPASGEDGTAVFNPGNSSDAYIYTNNGFYYSTDGGQTFTHSPQIGGNLFTFSGTNNLIAVDPSTPSTVYVVTNGGIYASSDWGATFTQKPWSFSNPSLIVVSPTSSQWIFVGDSTGLHFTLNGGTAWSQSSLPGASGTPASLAIDPLNTSIILVGLSSSAEIGGGIWKSSNSGVSFTSANTGIITEPLVTGIAVWSIAFQPGTESVAAATTHGLYISFNKAQGWTNYSGNTTPYWFTDIAWSDNYLYASTYGEGVLRLAFDFSLTNSGGITVAQGSSGTTTLTATLIQGIPEVTSLSCTSGLPIGAVCQFNPTSNQPTFTSMLIINASASTPTGTYTIIASGTAAGVIHTTQFTLTISSPSVGGSATPVDKPRLLLPYVAPALGLVVAIASAMFLKRSLRRPPS